MPKWTFHRGKFVTDKTGYKYPNDRWKNMGKSGRDGNVVIIAGILMIFVQGEIPH
jgi:hypothetical protein